MPPRGPTRGKPEKKCPITINIHILDLTSRHEHPYTPSAAKHTLPLPLHPATSMREVFALAASYMALELKIFVDRTRFEARDRAGHVFNEDDKIGEEIGEGGEVWLVENAISEDEVRRAERRRFEAREAARLIEKEKARIRRLATKNAKMAKETPARQLASQGALGAKSEPRKTPVRNARARTVNSESNVRAGRKRVLSSPCVVDSDSSSPVAGRSPSPVHSRSLAASASIRSPSPVRAKPVTRLLRVDDKPGGLLESIEKTPPVEARKRTAMKLPTVRDEFDDPLDFFEDLTPHSKRSTERRGLSSPPASVLQAPKGSTEILDSSRPAQSPINHTSNNLAEKQDTSAVLEEWIKDSSPIAASHQGLDTVSQPADKLDASASTVASQQSPPSPTASPSIASETSHRVITDTRNLSKTSPKSSKPRAQPADEVHAPAPSVASQHQQASPIRSELPAPRSSEQAIPDSQALQPRVIHKQGLRDAMATNWNWTAINRAQPNAKHPQSVSPGKEALKSLPEPRAEKLGQIVKSQQCKIDPYDISAAFPGDGDDEPSVKTPAPTRSIRKLGTAKRQPSTVANPLPRNSLSITNKKVFAKPASQNPSEAPIQDQRILLPQNSMFTITKPAQAKTPSQQTLEALAQLEGTIPSTPITRVPTNTPNTAHFSAHAPPLSSPTTHVAAALAKGRATARRRLTECIDISSDDAVCEDVLVDAREKFSTPAPQVLEPVCEDILVDAREEHPTPRLAANSLEAALPWSAPPLRVEDSPLRLKGEDPFWTLRTTGRRKRRRSEEEFGEGGVRDFGELYSKTASESVRDMDLEGCVLPESKISSFNLGSPVKKVVKADLLAVTTPCTPARASLPIPAGKSPLLLVHGSSSSQSGVEEIGFVDIVGSATGQPVSPAKVTEAVIIDETSSVQDGEDDIDCDLMSGALQGDVDGEVQGDFMMSGELLAAGEEHDSPMAPQESSEPQQSVEPRQSIEADQVVLASDGTTSSENDQVHEIGSLLLDLNDSEQSVESMLVRVSDQDVEPDQIAESEHACEAQKAVESAQVVESEQVVQSSPLLNCDQGLNFEDVLTSDQVVQSAHTAECDQIVRADQIVECSQSLESIQDVEPTQAMLSDDGESSPEENPVFFPVLYELPSPRPALKEDEPQTPRHPLPLLRVPETDPKCNVPEMATPPSAQASKRKREFSDELDTDEEQRMRKRNRREAKRVENRRLRDEKEARAQDQQKQQEAWRQDERKRRALEKARRRALELEIVVSSPLKAAEMGLGWSEGDEDLVESEIGSSPPRRPVVTRLFTRVEGTVDKKHSPVRKGSDERQSWRELSKKHASALPSSIDKPAAGVKDDIAKGVVKVEASSSPFVGGAKPAPLQAVPEMPPEELTAAELPTPQASREAFDDWALLQVTLGAGAYSPFEIHNRIHLQRLNETLHGIASQAALKGEAIGASEMLSTTCDDSDTGMTVKSEGSVYHSASESFPSSRAREVESPVLEAKKKHGRKDKEPRISKRKMIVNSESPKLRNSSTVPTARHAQEDFEEGSSQTDVSRHTIRSPAPSPKNLTAAPAQAWKEVKGNTTRGKRARRRKKDGARKKKWQHKHEKVHRGLYKEVRMRSNFKHGSRIKEEPL